MGKLEKVEEATRAERSDDDAAPPSYNAAAATSLSPEDIDQLNSAFSSLKVPLIADEVTVDTCLAHLKLLFAFQTLKEAVGYTDGLWQIYDSEVSPDKEGKNLSLLREKRWALYVARAARRYSAWWNSFPIDPLTEDHMLADTPNYTQFASAAPPNLSAFAERSDMLPPIDVLMVWHAHMLNPRAYFEDCMRHGLRELWHTGLPWQRINDAIDTSFNYKVSPEYMVRWEQTTKRKWENADDPSTETLPSCPECKKINVVPWSTCSVTRDSSDTAPSLVGQGYGDGEFKTNCANCGKILKRDYIEVRGFTNDVKRLLAQKRPMPGTILDNRTGMATRLPQVKRDMNRFPRTFPNRLIRYELRSRLYDPPPASMDDIRAMIEKTLKDTDAIKRVEQVDEKSKNKTYLLAQDARIQVRKMMSRYWGNSSPFALELGGAVLRQGIFTEKMYKMDWLHSPAAHETMTRLIKKYQRFTEIMGANTYQIAVPTLDVDLAWHTHQLSPASYYQWMCSKTGRFIDHDDKIDENKLSTAFEWTSKTYQKLYGEVYSECTCWYCESVRVSHSSGIAERLPILKSEKSKGSYFLSRS
ncbi:hypothetical protein F5Y14DRAFT_460544 [Nemania sp. NC0429]|nr:hypothetical protein F5Y14DRAFT_460544 [Nemania sp. NC0429]